MKASELRIGNWVNSYDHNSEPHQVDADDIVYCATVVGSGHFEPIPLTEEWLKTFGFDGLDYGIYKQADGSYSLVDDYGDGSTFYIGSIQYVHQLQNLYFALTGEELTIKEQ